MNAPAPSRQAGRGARLIALLETWRRAQQGQVLYKPRGVLVNAITVTILGALLGGIRMFSRLDRLLARLHLR